MTAGRSLFLMRHGHIGREGGPRRCTGVTDTPLSPGGIRQAKALAGWLGPRPLTGVFSSNLSRCAETARIIAQGQGLGIKAVPELHEIGMGAWENLTFQEVRERYPEDYEKRGKSIADFTPSGGESFRQCQERAWPALMRILEETAGDVAVVAHAGVNRVLLCRMLGMDLNDLFRLRQDYGCVNIIGLEGNEFSLRLFNFVPGRGSSLE